MPSRPMSGHHHNAGLWQLRSEDARDRGAAEARHVLVDERDVGTQPAEKLKREIAVVGLADNLDGWIRGEARPKRATKVAVAVPDQYANR
jgi:hypothetical protein